MPYSFNIQNLDWPHANKFCEDRSHERRQPNDMVILKFFKEFLLKSIH